MRFLTAILLASAVSFASPAFAEKCDITTGDVHAADQKFIKENPGAKEAIYIDDDAQKIRAEITARNGGAESIELDLIIAVDMSTTTSIAVIKDGCVVVHFTVPTEEWADVINSALGKKS
jgi:hypothetical protein